MSMWRIQTRAAAMAALMIMAWGWGATTQAQPNAGASAPAVILTHPDNDPPYAWLDESGAARGAVVEFWRQWGAQAGLSVQFVLASPEECRRLVLSGRANAHAGDIQDPNLERNLHFGGILMERAVALFVLDDNAIRTLDDLREVIEERKRANRPGVRVGVMAGSYAAEYMALIYPDCVLADFDDAEAMLLGAARGSVEAVVMDTGAMQWHQARGVERRFRQVGGAADVLYRIVVRPAVNLDNVGLLGRMNNAMEESGGGAAILSRFMQSGGAIAGTAPGVAGGPQQAQGPGRFVYPVALALMGLVLLGLGGTLARRKSLERKMIKEWAALREENKERLKEVRALSRENKEINEQLKFLSTHDSLTMLPTRRVLDLVFPQLAAQMSRHGKMMALMHVDLDNFKQINEALGHAAGDTVLKLTTERLLALVRKSDLVVRLGGDEFIVVLTNLDKRLQAGEVADKMLYKLGEPARVAGKQISPHASIGIVFFPNDGKNLAELLQHADNAMCIVKATGKKSWKIWNDGGDLIPARGGITDAKADAADASGAEWPVEEAVGVDDLFEELEAPADDGEKTIKVAITPGDSPAMESHPPAANTTPNDESAEPEVEPIPASPPASQPAPSPPPARQETSAPPPRAPEPTPGGKKKNRRKKHK